MLTKNENLAAIENFSQNLEIQGRSLWQDARIRFMRNKAAMVSLFFDVNHPGSSLSADVFRLQL